MKKIRENLRKLGTPEFITGSASGLLAALFSKIVSDLVQRSFNNQIIGYYGMVVIVLVCLIIIGYFLIRIEKLVENRNYIRFITSKAERLNLMTYYIKNAKKSIYIISDLSGTQETQLKEHVEYLKALNQALDDKNVDIKRIIVPPYANNTNTEIDPDWIYKVPVAETYLEHFNNLRHKDKVAPKHNHIPRNVSLILIDNKYLFLKPEITYGDENLDALMDGGIYLEQYTKKGIVTDFVEGFEIMFGGAHKTDVTKLCLKAPEKQSNEGASRKNSYG